MKKKSIKDLGASIMEFPSDFFFALISLVVASLMVAILPFWILLFFINEDYFNKYWNETNDK